MVFASIRWAPIRIYIVAVAPGSLLTGCTVGPNYVRPQVATPAEWRSPLPHGGSSAALVDWWSQFDDPTLKQLQKLAERDSPTLDQAVARISQARATLSGERAAALPNVTASASSTSTGQSGSGRPAMVTSEGGLGSIDAGWEIDLFGKVRRRSEAARARVDERIADWNDARISLAAEVADDYVQYRGCEQKAAVYAEMSKSQAETTRLTEISARAGFTSAADAQLAVASAAKLRSNHTDQQSQCDLLLKSLVSLTASDEPQLRGLLISRTGDLPVPGGLGVDSVPANVIRERPDVASAERELAATSAEIGATIADLYPSLSLSGSVSATAGLTQWSFGPTLSLPIFDGGRRQASVGSARAGFDLQLASYRQTVRTAILEVEQTLVKLNAARLRERDTETSARGYQANFEATDKLRRAGGASMIDTESARRNALDARLSLIDVRVAQVRDWIALYKAIGGGWQPSSASPSPSTGSSLP